MSPADLLRFLSKPAKYVCSLLVCILDDNHCFPALSLFLVFCDISIDFNKIHRSID